jgi:hypothetical protein
MRCNRCGKETTVTIMSMFNRDSLCMDCKDAEKRHPDYALAFAADEAAIRAGNFNYAGVGWTPERNTQ